jgi:ribosome-associated protein
MDIRKLQRAIVDGLEDVKGQNIAVFNTEHLSPLFERVIIASGTSNRQTRALAASVRDAVKGRGLATPRIEGEDNGEWIIVDCGAAVVHLMQPGIRDYYHLEEIWGEKPVRMKLDGAPKRLVKAAAAQEQPAGLDEAASRAAARPKRSGSRAAGADTGAGAAKKVAAKRAPAKKAAAAKSAVSRTSGTKQAPPRAGATAAGGSESLLRQAAVWTAAPAKGLVRKAAGKNAIAPSARKTGTAGKVDAVRKIAVTGKTTGPRRRRSGA